MAKKLKTIAVKELFDKLEQADKVVTTILQKGENFKVLALAFREGMVFPKHQTKLAAKLIVLEGNVLYEEKNKAIELNQYDEYTIPVDVPHWVTARQPSLCIVIIGE